MSLTDDLRQFAVAHRRCGTLTYTASAAAESGYALRLRCRLVRIARRLTGSRGPHEGEL